MDWEPFPSPGHLPEPGTEPMSLALAGGFFTTSTTWEAPELTYDLAILLLGIHLKKMKTLIQIDTCIPMFTETLQRPRYESDQSVYQQMNG